MFMQARKTTAILIQAMFCVALAPAVAQSAPPTATYTITPEERASALQQIQTTRDNFVKSIAGLSRNKLSFISGPERWSVAQASQHISVSESTIFGFVHKMMQSPATPEK